MVICESELRARLGECGERVLRLRDGDILTPAARDFAKAYDFRIETVAGNHPYREMSRTPIPTGGGWRFVDLQGTGYAEKPEHMTHLRGNVLVPKDHPRIALRGKLDSFQAKVIEAQIAAGDEGRDGVIANLQDVLAFAQDILASEVTELPFERDTLLGMRDDELRAVSHNPLKYYGSGHLMPDYRMGRTVAALNSLRTLARETELAAMRAFATDADEPQRPDLIRALNRLSSVVYILICRIQGGYYGSGRNGD